MSLGLSAWTVVVLPFRDAFAVFPLRVLSVGAGELAFLDWGAPDLAFLRGSPTVITKVDSKLRSLESPSRLGFWLAVLRVFDGLPVPAFFELFALRGMTHRGFVRGWLRWSSFGRSRAIFVGLVIDSWLSGASRHRLSNG